MSRKFLIHAHRGDRVNHPENTLQAFISVVNCGADAIEADVVMSACGEVVVSHDPFFSRSICSGFSHLPNNLYKLKYAQIKEVNCGFPAHPDFPKQQTSVTYKPLLSEVISRVEAHCKKHGIAPVNYNIEIKSSPRQEPEYQPPYDEFALKVAQTALEKLSYPRFSLHSFDYRVLRWLHEYNSKLRLGQLVETRGSARKHMRELGFTPTIYGCDYSLVTASDVNDLQDKGVIVLPFTVNRVDDMERLYNMDVHGLVTDLPGLAAKLFKD